MARVVHTPEPLDDRKARDRFAAMLAGAGVLSLLGWLAKRYQDPVSKRPLRAGAARRWCSPNRTTRTACA